MVLKIMDLQICKSQQLFGIWGSGKLRGFFGEGTGMFQLRSRPFVRRHLESVNFVA